MLTPTLKHLAFTLLIVFSPFASSASENNPGYEKLASAQPTQNPDKVEVIEFFWYGCPHCYSFEPLIDKWSKTKPDNVQFIRQPAIFSKLWGKHAKAYFTAEALDAVDKIHTDFFNTIQNLKRNCKLKSSWPLFLSPMASKKKTSRKLTIHF